MFLQVITHIYRIRQILRYSTAYYSTGFPMVSSDVLSKRSQWRQAVNLLDMLWDYSIVPNEESPSPSEVSCSADVTIEWIRFTSHTYNLVYKKIHGGYVMKTKMALLMLVWFEEGRQVAAFVDVSCIVHSCAFVLSE